MLYILFTVLFIMSFSLLPQGQEFLSVLLTAASRGPGDVLVTEEVVKYLLRKQIPHGHIGAVVMTLSH